MARSVLQQASFNVVTATNATDGIALATQLMPDLILMDGVMPELSGIEAISILRAKEATKSIPILMLTSKNDEEYVKAAYASGCSDYVTKPINGTELLTKIRGLLEDS